MMELGCLSDTATKDETNGNASHSLPERWNTQRLRAQTSFPGMAKVASLSAALITSSSASSEDYEEDWLWNKETMSSQEQLRQGSSRNRRGSNLRSIISGLCRRPSSPVWDIYCYFFTEHENSIICSPPSTTLPTHSDFFVLYT